MRGHQTVLLGECLGGFGFDKFLAHSRFEYNAERTTQYLKDNQLGVVRVEMK